MMNRGRPKRRAIFWQHWGGRATTSCDAANLRLPLAKRSFGSRSLSVRPILAGALELHDARDARLAQPLVMHTTACRLTYGTDPT